MYSDISSTYDLITIFLFLMRVGRYPAGLLHIDMSDVEKSSSANKLTWLEILMVNDGLGNLSVRVSDFSGCVSQLHADQISRNFVYF